ncbi:DUF1887 family CARF protein [Bacteroides sp. AN502(2024)]|uniref:Card1-like endonuclease domain-containing protein n=1 Tax=Bacteroides sp. AN502(2024) TaxID=3160599 RepID=UPI0035148C2E
MNHIHIALLGAQSYPVYLGIIDQHPDEVILIHSVTTLDEAIRVRCEIEKQEIKLPVQLIEFDPVDISRIFSQLKKHFANLSFENLYSVNISGGTKLWSVAFYEYFREYPHVRLLYIDQNNYICDLKTAGKRLSDVPLDTDIVFRLNGTLAKSYTLLSEYTEKDTCCLKKIKDLRRHSYDGFKGFSMPGIEKWNEIENKKEGCWMSADGALLWDKPAQRIIIRLLNKKGIVKEETLESPHVFSLFFHAGWFEYEVARILSGWKYAKEIRLNVKFPYNAERNPKNEIDVIVNTGNRLLFVECKTQISFITDIDKFRTAVKNYGGMACKALFVTEAVMKNTAREKCEDSGILSFSLENSFANLSVAEQLYIKLELELFEINKK